MKTKNLLDVPAKLTLTAVGIIKSMYFHAESAQVEKVERCADALFNIITLSMFPRNKIDPFNNKINELREVAFRRRISNIIGELKVNLRNGDFAIDSDVIGEIHKYVSLALVCGADNEYRDEIMAEISRIKIAGNCNLEGADASILSKSNGISYNEKRRTLRFAKPSLCITIDGLRYKTVDWSPCGLLIDNYVAPICNGDHLRLHVNSADANGGGLICGRAVERPELHNKLAIDLEDLSPIILNLMHELKTRGIQPSV